MQTVQPVESHLDEDELFTKFVGEPLLLKLLRKFTKSKGANRLLVFILFETCCCGQVGNATGDGMFHYPERIVIFMENEVLSRSSPNLPTVFDPAGKPKFSPLVSAAARPALVTPIPEYRRVDDDDQSNGGFTVDVSRANSNLAVVRLALINLGWQELKTLSFQLLADDIDIQCVWNAATLRKPAADISWMATVPYNWQCIDSFKVNKFPGMQELTKKVSLTQSLSTMQKLFPDDYNFYPKSWSLPAQMNQFLVDHSENVSKNGDIWYIAKPDGGAQGENIQIFRRPSQLSDQDQLQIVQEYILEPFLLNDKLKFDLRVYAVIKSINPLSIYVAKEGLARFCTTEYNRPSTANRNVSFMHLTNFSLNKQNASFVKSDDLFSNSASKRLMSNIFAQMEFSELLEHNGSGLWREIKHLIVKTIVALVPELILYYENLFAGSTGCGCFQIIGFDILLNKNLKPILLEINACPSLTIGDDDDQDELDFDQMISNHRANIVDFTVKFPLVKDTLLLVTGNYDPSKSCLLEVFPSQYGNTCGRMLLLLKAAYLFMQFVNIKRSMAIGLSACKTFIKKCALSDVISTPELEETFKTLIKTHAALPRIVGSASNDPRISYQGFVELLLHVSLKKYGRQVAADNVVECLDRLLGYGQTQLRYHGVRSAKLRAESAVRNLKWPPTSLYPVKDLYLLPQYCHKILKERRSGGEAKRQQSFKIFNNNEKLILPRL
uniref:Uncharacterized protein n=1 Tax=Romanomermis culicivorax TaxID=13658 RepID=A0A915IIF9_ROMCU